MKNLRCSCSFSISQTFKQRRSLFKMMKLICLSILVVLLSSQSVKCEENKVENSAVKASIPMQIYRCIQRFNLLRCLKYFVLLRLESRDYPFSDKGVNSTMDFLANIFKSEKNLPSHIPERITQLDDDELDSRLTMGFQKFFHDRPIKLHFIPNMLVKIVPSNSNDLEVSLKRITAAGSSGRAVKDTKGEENDYFEDETDNKDVKLEDDKENDSSGDVKKDEAEKSNRRKTSLLHVGVPLLLTPYMVFAGFLPMLIPVLKLATIFTTIVNVTAFIASVMYLARQHAFEKEMQQTIYFNPGYKE